MQSGVERAGEGIVAVRRRLFSLAKRCTRCLMRDTIVTNKNAFANLHRISKSFSAHGVRFQSLALAGLVYLTEKVKTMIEKPITEIWNDIVESKRKDLPSSLHFDSDAEYQKFISGAATLFDQCPENCPEKGDPCVKPKGHMNPTHRCVNNHSWTG